MEVIGNPFECIEANAIEFIAGLGPCLVTYNDPPWSTISSRLPPTARGLLAANMELEYLEDLAKQDFGDVESIVGLGGGTALDTAKFVAWKTGVRLVQVPTITSVDAGFTDAIGVRVGRRVRYVGNVTPEVVVLDLDLIRSAPPRLNRAGIGDVLSCHTGLFDWQMASDAGHGHPWRQDLAELGARLLRDLEEGIEEVAQVSNDGVRLLAASYRMIGAACAEAGHSRFEEGSEHFWAYHYEHLTGDRHAHGELISFAVCALAAIQGNDPEWARSIVVNSGTRAHPDDLGIDRSRFVEALLELPSYSRAEDLDMSVVDFIHPTLSQAEAAWDLVESLPRVHH